MSSSTRAEMIERIAASHPTAEQGMYRGVLDIFFEVVLGADDGEPVSREAKLAVLAAIVQERDRLVADAGYSSIEELEASR